ncbi:major facilitator superfamily domain-containing protein [Diaporthe sp. PMI_573]|nr:major facilitator superfamily domain-containing protein [Diaporthaceae sp. PMI_573]
MQAMPEQLQSIASRPSSDACPVHFVAEHSTMQLEPVVSCTTNAGSEQAPVTAESATSTPSRSRSAAIIFSITCITGISNLLAGLLTVCIPVIATDLGIESGLQLWPASAFALACGCTLLLCATAADLLGCRRVCLLGATLQAGSALGAGLSKTPTQLIALRAFAGVAASMCLPSAAGIVSSTFPHSTRPRTRTAAFSAMGGGQAVGFGLGLALGGLFSGTVGWRWGFHATAILNVLVLVIALWSLPISVDDAAPLGRDTAIRLRKELDWLGALIISTSLAFLSYVLAVVTDSDASNHMRQPLNIVFLGTGVALMPVHVFWMHHQKLQGRPALIPNELWQSKPFTSVCITVFLVWGALNASEQLTALYLQDVREFSTLTSSLYFLPAPVCGILTNVAVAVFLPRLKASYAVPVGCLVSGLAPLLLAALCRVQGPSYWGAIFQAMAINPIGADLMYTIAMLVVTDAFPSKTQALAGGVFNMVAQIGKSVGIATTAIIAQQVSSPLLKSVDAREALLRGYHAGWWYNCGLSLISVVVSLWGLRSVGRLGVKRD